VSSFEQALGFILGDGWDIVVEENVDEAFSLFKEFVNYSYTLPDRMLAETG